MFQIQTWKPVLTASSCNETGRFLIRKSSNNDTLIDFFHNLFPPCAWLVVIGYKIINAFFHATFFLLLLVCGSYCLDSLSHSLLKRWKFINHLMILMIFGCCSKKNRQMVKTTIIFMTAEADWFYVFVSRFSADTHYILR